jgi:uracil-DNA glycosylase
VQLAEAERLANVEFEGGLRVYPPLGLRFEALRKTGYESVRAVILGQDPYHRFGQAHGLAFSTLAEKCPRSLQNILQEWQADLGEERPESGTLEPWALHGVLLLNTALTVKEGVAGGHARCWAPFTRAVVEVVADKPGQVAFLLWGGDAMGVGRSVDLSRHVVVRSSHPSPRSAHRPCGEAPAFLGRRPFSCASKRLDKPIDWSLRRIP